VLLVRPALDFETLRGALYDLHERVELLRTTLESVGGMAQPLQVISERVPRPRLCHEAELRGRAVSGRGVADGYSPDSGSAGGATSGAESGIERAGEGSNETVRLALSAAELLRSGRAEVEGESPLSVVLVGGEGESALVLSVGALYGDAAGVRNLGRELSRCYAAREAGGVRGGADGAASDGDDGQPEEAAQYADLSEWQNELMESEETAAGREYWRRLGMEAGRGTEANEAGGAGGGVDGGGLRPWGGPRRRVGGLGAGVGVLRRELGGAELAVVRGACRGQGVGEGEWLLGCWAAYWWRARGEAVTVGARFGGRRYEGLAEAPGLFARYLPVRLTLEAGMSAGGAGRAAAGAVRELAKWQEYYEGASEAEGWEVAYSYDGEDEGWREGAQTWGVAGGHEWTEACGVKLVCRSWGDGRLSVELYYDVGRVTRAAAGRLLDGFMAAVGAASARPAERLGRLPVVGEAERRTLLDEWSGAGERAEAAEGCVHELFERQAALTPDAVAVVYGEQRMSYRELDSRSNRLAHLLRSRGVGPDQVVGICLPRCFDLVVSILAVLKAGGAYLPLDTQYPPQRLSFMLKDSGARLVLTHADLRERLGEHRASALCVEESAAELEPQDEAGSGPEAGVGVEPEHLAYVIYTSGSTGLPKGVMVHHRGLRNYLGWSTPYYEVARGAGSPLHSPIGFDLSVTSLFPALLAGRSVYLLPEGEGLEALGRLLLTEGGLSLLKITPTHLELLRQMTEGDGLEGRAGALVIGGEQLPGEQLRYWRERAPGTRLINEYGPTETVVGCCVHEVGEGEELKGAVAIGRPIANTRMYVLDAEMSPVPVGAAGELYVGGDGVTRGYLGRPGLTAERFVPDPFSSEGGARLYRTGDLGRYREDGELEYLGRLDEQVKVRGYRIELGEVEAALREIEGVGECVVVARDEDGGGGKRLVAYLVGEGVEVAELRRRLRERLPDYMIPSSFVAMDRLPLTANGKVDKRALPAPTAGGAERVGYVAPRDEVEALLCEVWGEVLRAGRVGLHDNFFSLGGDSILGIQVVARANRSGLRLSPRMIFQHQTVAELASAAREAGPSARAEAGEGPEQGEVVGPVPLTPIQRRFFEQERPDPHHFNQSLLLSSRRPLERRLLEGAAEALLRQHDALRLRFSRGEGGAWRQWCAPYEEGDAGRAVLCYDLSGLAPGERAEALGREAERIQGGLDLGEGPLLRMGYFQYERGGEGRLLIVIHHLCVDGVSWRVLLEDLRRAYEALGEGKAVDLGPKTGSYRQWALRLEEYAATGEARGEAQYWLGVAGGAGGRLPRGKGVGEQEGAGSAAAKSLEEDTRVVSASMGEAETRLLLQEAGGAYRAQIQEVLLAALAEAVCEWAGADTVLCDVEGHGRESEFVGGGLDVTRTVGWFTTVYPVVLERGGDGGGVVEALRRMKVRLRGVRGGGVGYGVARYLVGGEAAQRLRRAEDAGMSFNYLGQFDGALGEGGEWGVGGERAGEAHSARGEREYAISVTASVTGGRLRVNIEYSGREYGEEEINALAGRYLGALEELIGRRAEGGGLTPSDFPLSGLSQERLDELTAEGRLIEDIYPLSPIQEGLLFQSLYAPEAAVYFEQLSCNLRGAFDVDAFKQAWQELTDRHPILRTSFVWEKLERPLQVVSRRVDLPLEQQDWRDLYANEQAKQFEALLEADRRRGFDLSEPSLMRLTLLRTGEDSYRFVWSHHHLLLDGWSMQLLIKEVFARYVALSSGRQQTPHVHPQPYANYIAWLQRQDVTKAEAFWRELLKGFTLPTVLEGSGRRGEAPRPGESYAEQRRLLTEELTARLQQLARQQQVTLNTVIQGAWALLLSLYSGEGDVLFGATVSGRPAELDGIEGMVGLFINTLPVRVKVVEGMRMSDWLRRLQEQQAAARQYEYSSLVDVQGWSEVPRGAPLFESMLAFENYPVDDALREGAEQLGLGIDDVRLVEATHYPLALVAVPGAQMLARIIYDRGRFDESSVVRMLKHFEVLLERMAGGAEQQVSQIGLLTEAERSEILSEWNETRAEYPSEKCLHELFEEQVARTPEALALVFEDERLTYAELNEKANRLAHYLRRGGVGPDSLVGICMERGVEMLLGVLGVLKAGGAYVPVDPAYPRERQAYMLEDSRAVALLTRSELAEGLPGQSARVIRLDAEWELISEESAENPVKRVDADNLLYVIYTSGSTGRPKGVAMRHGPLTNLLTWQLRQGDLPRTVKTLQFTSLSFDVSCQEIFTAWCSGGTLVAVSEQTRRDAERLLDVLVESGVERLFLPFVALQHLAEVAERRNVVPGSLKEVITAGEQLQITPHVAGLFGRLPGCTLHNQYGPAETHVATALTLCGEPHTWPSLPAIGRPVDNATIYILDSRMQPVPVGVAGELYIGGETTARGYLHRPALTAEKFVPDAFGREAGARLYKTGDLARYAPDGRIEFLGRLDHQVKIRGFRVELGEIEAVLSTHPAVRECVVTARTEASGDKRLAAYIVLQEDGGAPAQNELRSFIKERLPEYMVPSAFVVLEALPLTPSGKVNRRALPAPTPSRRDLEDISARPRTPVEELLSGIIAQVLQVERVGRDDNFFDLGGHSLLATQVISRLREALRVELPLRSLFESPTVGDLAASVEAIMSEQKGAAAPPVTAVPREEPLPLSFAQQRLWFLDQLDPNSPLYNIPGALRLHGSLNVAALERALNEIVRRHEVLRTNFVTVKRDPVQVITPQVDLPLPVIDLRDVPPEEEEAALRRLSEEEARRPFNLAVDRLLRVKLLRLADDEHALLFTIHHIVSDGWTMGILVRETTVLYDAFAAGKPSPLAELPVQYADFAVWQHRWLQGEALEAQLQYWKKQLGGSPAALRLPTDRARSSEPDFHGALLPVAFPADVSRALTSLSRRENVTLFMTLLAAFKALLYYYTEEPDLIVGTPVANRNRVETESLIGFFVNTLVMRTDLSGNPTFRELLGRVREVVLQAHTHQDLPFEKLVAELQTGKSLNRAPLFHVWFVLQNAPLSPVQLQGLTLSPLPVHSGTARHELKLDLFETPDGLRGSFEYNTSLFDASTVARFSEHLELLLSHVSEQPDAALSDLQALLAEADRRRLLAEGREFRESRHQRLKGLKRRQAGNN
jgi:amino acid adenylation domain-containing protein/non-ribosomal peptide synthase protein (TIGR01720 family)